MADELMQGKIASLWARVRDLPNLSLGEIDDLHFDCEMLYARLLYASLKGSEHRRRLFAEAYCALTKVLTERRRRFGRRMDSMGFNADSVERILPFINPGARILDVGCSTGVLVEALGKQGFHAEGVDIAGDLVAAGNDRLRAAGIGAEGQPRLHCSDFLELYEQIESYDLIHSNDVLEHIHPDECAEFLQKCRRLLKPGGILWLITPNRLTGPGDATALRHRIGTQSRGLHLKEYTLRELVRLLREQGFSRVQSQMWGKGRFRPWPSGYAASYVRLKALLEPAFRLVPGELRRRVMGILCYAEVLAFKASVGVRSEQPECGE